MNECVIAGSPTPAFVERFENAGGLYAQYCRQGTSTDRQELARKALEEVKFIELEPCQQTLVKKLMAYHEAESVSDQLDIINWVWYYYNT